jgi:hypothetical protein
MSSFNSYVEWNVSVHEWTLYLKSVRCPCLVLSHVCVIYLVFFLTKHGAVIFAHFLVPFADSRENKAELS